MSLKGGEERRENEEVPGVTWLPRDIAREVPMASKYRVVRHWLY